MYNGEQFRDVLGRYDIQLVLGSCRGVWSILILLVIPQILNRVV
jgi:hypothetical protein